MIDASAGGAPAIPEEDASVVFTERVAGGMDHKPDDYKPLAET